MKECCKKEVEKVLDAISARVEVCRSRAYELLDQNSINELKQTCGIAVKKNSDVQIEVE